jgi:hypothetical protein
MCGLGGGATARPMTAVWNRLAYDRAELLSAEHSPDVLAARRARTYDGDPGKLNRWVDGLRSTLGEQIPYFDPAAATHGARVLLLFQDPSQEAEEGSGFISRHNNDQTARNAYLAAEEAGLAYEVSLHWNVVPWWIANPGKPRRTAAAEALRARPFLVQLFELLDPSPDVVVVSGRQAQAAWRRLAGDGVPTGLRRATVLTCPHPGPLAYPRRDMGTGRLNSELIVETFRRAARIVAG